MFNRLKLKRTRKANLARDKSGATALEFAMIAPVFFSMVFGLLEMGWLFTRMSLLDGAVAEAGRQVYTGAASHGFVSQSDIEDSICERVYFMSAESCKNNVALELTVIEDFSDIPEDNAVCSDDTMSIQPVTDYEPGAESEIIYMRACVTVPLLMPGLGMAAKLPQTDDGRFQVISAMTFMNEPFGSSGSSGPSS